MKNRVVLLLFLFGFFTTTGIFLYSSNAQKDNPPLPQKKSFEPALFISSEQVSENLKQTPQRTYLIDIRSAEEFKKARIPGSLNIPLFSLPHQSFLKQKKCILVNEGYGYKPLVDACAQLKKAGFAPVRILQGGLYGWQRSGRRLEGDSGVNADFQAISLGKFLQDKKFSGIAAIHITNNTFSQDASLLLPGAVAVKADDDIPDLLKTIIQAVHSIAGPDPLYAVITGDDPAMIAKLRQRSMDEVPFNTFYLDGGMKTYEAYLQIQTQSRKPKKMKTSGSRCATCG